MNAWWNSIPPNEKIYWFLAFPFTAMFILQTLMTFIGFGDDASESIESNHDTSIQFDNPSALESHHAVEDAAAPFKLLTIRNIIVFFTVFSWSGISTLKSGFNNITAFLLSFVLGAALASLLSSIFYLVSKLTSSGTLNLDNAVNCIGEVYLSIPANKKGTGKVMMSVQGSLRELDAFTEGEELSTGTKVIVTQIIENQYLLVEKYN
jgi:hypothetical protein